MAARDRALRTRDTLAVFKSQMSYKRRFRTSEAPAMRDIAFVVYPGYSLMALAVVTGFEVANTRWPTNRLTTSISSPRPAGRSGPRRACVLETEAFGGQAVRHARRRRRDDARAVDAGPDRLHARGARSATGASPRSAPAPSCWPRRACWTAGAPPPTGCMRATCSSDSAGEDG